MRGISWDGIFPVHDYPFRRDASMDGQEYYEKLKSWQKRKLPVRLVITSTGFANISINMAVAIEKLVLMLAQQVIWIIRLNWAK